MAKYVVEDFRAGLDLRRSELTAPAGTARELTNCHITQGGEIEKREEFFERLSLPPETLGLAYAQGKYWTFSNSAATTPSPDPDLIDILRLNTTDTLSEFLDFDLFDDQIYSVFRMSDNSVKHFNGTALVAGAQGDTVRTYRSKMHSISQGGKTLYFTAVGNPADWTGDGSGAINLSNQDADGGTTTALEAYYNQLAVGTLKTSQLWAIDPDPLLNDLQQILRQSGMLARHGVQQIGDGDVVFISDTGIRSLRARNSSLAAGVSDIGSPVDPLVRGWIRSLTGPQISNAQLLIHPISGRLWAIFPQGVLVLSNFPSPKITAWSIYQPGFVIKDAATGNDNIGMRSDDNRFFTYGGLGTPRYDNSKVTVRFPYLHLEDPGMFKTFHGLDVTAENTWSIFAGYDVQNVATRDLIATVDGPSFNQGRISMQGHATHIGLTFECERAGSALLANARFQYEKAEDD